MEGLILEIHDIIKDYRIEDGIGISEDHIAKWVKQFGTDDREFLLSELLHILKQRYLNKTEAVEGLKNVFSTLAEKGGYGDVKEFLLHTEFLDLQWEDKSQKQLLEFSDKLIQENYGIGLDECGTEEVQNFLYLDDVLGTGKTIFRDLATWLGKEKEKVVEQFKYIKDQSQKIHVVFFFVHNWGWENFEHRWKHVFGFDVSEIVKLWQFEYIENKYLPTHFRYQAPKLEVTYPTEQEQPDFVREYLEELESVLGATKNEKVAYRPKELPQEENLFSSKENRIRYENILLHKGIDLINNETLNVTSIRALGYTVKDYKTFGLGAQVFTWRNIANNNPIVFWWEASSWIPLFKKRQNNSR